MPARRSGCSGVGVLLLFCFAVFAVIGWPIYLDTHGAAATGVLIEKRESVRIHYDEWFRRFEILAAYSIPGQPLEHRAICDVEEKTFDSLHGGDRVTVHYFANLLNQPFLPATHISPCTVKASIGSNPWLMRHVAAAVVSLLVILFLWKVLRIRIAAWLLLPWFCLMFAYLGLPRVEPQPMQPVPATATVDRVVTITTLGGANTRRSMVLPHPYQIVLLKYVPAGMDKAVVAVDKVDAGSAQDLKEGQSASIVYDRASPRIARLQQGTRLFPGQALTTVTLCCIAVVVLIALVAAVGGFFRLMRRGRL
jgi:hypothetical protein